MLLNKLLLLNKLVLLKTNSNNFIINKTTLILIFGIYIISFYFYFSFSSFNYNKYFLLYLLTNLTVFYINNFFVYY